MYIHIHIYDQIFQVYSGGLTPEALADIEAKDPNSVLSKAYKAKDEINKFLQPKYVAAEELIKNKQWTKIYGVSSHCLVSSLMDNDAIFDNNGDPGYTLSDKIDQTISWILAGYDTPATSLTNTIYAMYKHPEHTEVVRQAIINHEQLSDPNTIFKMDTLNSCNELDCFINEAQRMYGMLLFLNRVIRNENGLDFDSYHLPKGTSITIPVRWLHIGEGSWTESGEFKPSRFDKSKGQSKEERGDIGRYNNIPFATALHKCLGYHLGLLQMKVFITLLLRDYEFALDQAKLSDESEAINHMNVMNGPPHYNVYLKLKKR